MAAEITHAQEVMGSLADKLAGVSLSEEERKVLGAMFALALAVVGERDGEEEVAGFAFPTSSVPGPSGALGHVAGGATGPQLGALVTPGQQVANAMSNMMQAFSDMTQANVQNLKS
jgi:hypothetical protein